MRERKPPTLEPVIAVERRLGQRSEENASSFLTGLLSSTDLGWTLKESDLRDGASLQRMRKLQGAEGNGMH